MIGLLVLAIMAWNFYIGYRRGLFMQAYYVVSVIIAMCVAAYFYKSLGEAINLWVPYA
ncbi:CvpA family protein, partial [Streptococcus vestibularis]|nr:CvpA family protein [Streptococcus vestibularis]